MLAFYSHIREKVVSSDMPYCYKCGKKIEAGMNFCGNCGTSIRDVLATPELDLPPEARTDAFRIERVVPPETVKVPPLPQSSKPKQTPKQIAGAIFILFAAIALSIGIVRATDPDAFSWLGDLFPDGGDGGNGGGDGFRSCIASIFDRPPECSDGPGGDGTPKKTLLNNRDYGICRKVSNNGCIRR